MKAPEFTVIGENLHTTRVLLRRGPQVGPDGAGEEAILFADGTGASRTLRIPERERRASSYEEGRVKHVKVAVELAMAGEQPDAWVALDYLRALAQRQLDRGAHFLDLNVDEVSLRLDGQIAAMRWLVQTLAPQLPVPLSIDSSNLEIIRAGIEEAVAVSDGAVGPPLLNSASLERLEALELAAEYDTPVIVTAAGESGMPTNAEERVANAGRMVEAALARGIPLERTYVDPLVFPISVDGDFGYHCLDAIRTLRERYGPEVHITGGMSNVSFGLPNRRLLNDAFLLLAIEAGADSGIVDPTTTDPARARALDRSLRPVKLALDVLTGTDRYCRAYVKAYRAGELEPVAQ